MKRILSICLSVLLLLTMLPLGAVASDFNDGTMNWGAESAFVVDSVSAAPGRTVSVSVRTQNNPGICGLFVTLSYDASVLTPVEAVAEDFGEADATFGPLQSNPLSILWYDAIHPAVTTNGAVATIKFQVAEDAPAGEYPLTLSIVDPEDIFDANLEPVAFETINGTVTVQDHLAGDVTADGKFNVRDLGLLQQYLNLWDVSFKGDVADVTGDGKINLRDLGLMQQWMNDWNIELIPNNPPEEDMIGYYDSGNANADMTVYATVDKSVACFGQEIVVTVSIENNPGLVGWNVGAIFDESVFEVQSITEGNVFSDYNVTYGPKKSPAFATFANFIKSDIIDDGSMYTFTLRVKEDAVAGDYDILLGTRNNDLGNFSNSSWDTFDVRFQGATITVAHTYSADCDPNCDVCGASRTVNHQYDSDFDPYCNVCGTDNPDVLYVGDANADGKVNTRDIGLFQQYINLWDIEMSGWETTDVNYDGKRNVRDLGLMQQWMNDWDVILKPVNPPEEDMIGYYDSGNANADMTVYATVDKSVACFGQEIVVTVYIENNPGLVGWNVGALFDESIFEVLSITAGDVFPASGMSYSTTKKSPAFATFADFIESDIIDDGSMYTFTLRVKEDAVAGDYDILLGTRNNDLGNFSNADWDTFDVRFQGATIVVGHEYVESILNPTCGANGLKTYTCVCGDYYTELIPATGAHAYDNTCDAECNVCGAVRAITHSYSHNCDRDCNVCGAVRVAPHTVWYPCDTECQDCGVVIIPSAEHTYSYACDAYCDLCGAYRDVTGHTYSDACDVDCNLCGYDRNPPHMFDNACDAVCDNCGAMREVYGHAYDGDHDPTCNHCGAIREITVVPEDAPAFAVDDVRACYDSTFTVAVRIRNNPGVAAYRLNVHYDHALLELVSAEAGDFADISFGPTDADFFTMTWCDMIHDDNTTDGVVVWLTFRTAEGVDPAETTISLSYDADDVYNTAWENVPFYAVAGKVQLTEVELGDINGDGAVNIRDLGLLQRYLNHWSVEIVLEACDVNADGNVNLRDMGLLQQYLNGWDVEFG